MKRHWQWLWFAAAAVSVANVFVKWQKGDLWWAIIWAAIAVVWATEGVKRLREPNNVAESS